MTMLAIVSEVRSFIGKYKPFLQSYIAIGPVYLQTEIPFGSLSLHVLAFKTNVPPRNCFLLLLIQVYLIAKDRKDWYAEFRILSEIQTFQYVQISSDCFTYPMSYALSSKCMPALGLAGFPDCSCQKDCKFALQFEEFSAPSAICGTPSALAVTLCF
jgi:hypothetical protein